MANLFNEAELSNIKQTLSPIESVDYSKLPEKYGRQFGERGEIEEQQRQLELERTRQGFEQQRQQQLAGLSGQVGESALGAFGEAQTEQQDIQRQFGLTTKEVSKAVEPEIQKRFRMTQLRGEIAKKGIDRIRNLSQKQGQLMMRKFQNFQQNLAEKMFNEQDQLARKIEADHNKAVEDLRSKLLKRKTGSLLFSSLAKGLGMGLGALFAAPTGGLSMLAGAGIGGAFGGAAGGLYGMRR